MERQKRDFLRVIESNQGIIKSLCKAYYPAPEDQKDVFQDIILQIWKSFETFRGESLVSTWIYRVSLNTILAKVRKEKKQIITDPIGQSDLALANAMTDDDMELLHMVLRSLKDVDKAIVILYLEGYSSKEISQVLNTTPSNITTRLSRVKVELKSKFQNQRYELKQP